MAQQKQSARQVTDAAAAALLQPVIDEMTRDPIKTARKAHTKPDGFTGDKPGFFRGARINK
jgi:hypothetical protein